MLEVNNEMLMHSAPSWVVPLLFRRLLEAASAAPALREVRWAAEDVGIKREQVCGHAHDKPLPLNANARGAVVVEGNQVTAVDGVRKAGRGPLLSEQHKRAGSRPGEVGRRRAASLWASVLTPAVYSIIVGVVLCGMSLWWLPPMHGMFGSRTWGGSCAPGGPARCLS